MRANNISDFSPFPEDQDLAAVLENLSLHLAHNSILFWKSNS